MIFIYLITALIIGLMFYCFGKLIQSDTMIPFILFCGIIGFLLLLYSIYILFAEGLKEGLKIIGILLLLCASIYLLLIGIIHSAYYANLNNPVISSLIAAIPLLISQIVVNKVEKKTKKYKVFSIILAFTYSFIFIQFFISLVNITILNITNKYVGDAKIWAKTGSYMMSISKILPLIFYGVYIFISVGPFTRKFKKFSKKIVAKTRAIVLDNNDCVKISNHKKTSQNKFKEIDVFIIDAAKWTNFFVLMTVVECFVLCCLIIQISVCGFEWKLIAYTFSASLFYTLIFAVYYLFGYLGFLNKRKEINALVPDIKKFQQENPECKLASENLLDYNEMINLYIGIGILGINHEPHRIHTCIKLSPDLVVLNYARAGSLLSTKLKELQFDTYNDIDEMNEIEKHQTYQVFINNNLEKEGTVTETLTNNEKVEIILQDYKQILETYKENNKPFTEYLHEMEESLKNEIPDLPKISLHRYYKLKPYEYECNYNGNEIIRGIFFESENDKMNEASKEKLKKMSKTELHKELTLKLIEELRKGILQFYK